MSVAQASGGPGLWDVNDWCRGGESGLPAEWLL